MSSNTKPPIFQRFWKPAVATGAGGSAVAVWFEEILIYGEEILGLVFLSIAGGLICLFNIFVFKSRMPRRKDLEDINNTGVKK
jgi:hypothetical protein